jgi:thioredoxin-dependent peroxiredoxin
MLKAGDKAPEFRLKTDAGTELALADFRGHRVVLFFFPKANTPG